MIARPLPRTDGGKARYVYAGGGMTAGMYVESPIQSKAADPGDAKNGPKEGFFGAVEEK